MSDETPPDWRFIIERHAERVFRIAYRILGSVHDAEDVSQNVFAEACKVQAAGSVQSWSGLLARLATLRAIDQLRQRRKTMQLTEADRVSNVGPPDEAVGSELAAWLREATSRLPERQAAIFTLTYFEQHDRDEVASVLNISPEAVSTALYKTRQRLLSQLNVLNGERK